MLCCVLRSGLFVRLSSEITVGIHLPLSPWACIQSDLVRSRTVARGVPTVYVRRILYMYASRIHAIYSVHVYGVHIYAHTLTYLHNVHSHPIMYIMVNGWGSKGANIEYPQLRLSSSFSLTLFFSVAAASCELYIPFDVRFYCCIRHRLGQRRSFPSAACATSRVD